MRGKGTHQTNAVASWTPTTARPVHPEPAPSPRALSWALASHLAARARSSSVLRPKRQHSGRRALLALQPHRGQQRLCGWGKPGVLWTYVCERPAGARSSETEPGAVIKKILEVARELTEAGRARQNRCRGGLGRTWASGARAAPATWCGPTSTPRWAESRPVRSAGLG